MVSIIINGLSLEVCEGTTILEAARIAGIYIPVLCNHLDLNPYHSIELSEQIFQGDVIYRNDEGINIEDIKGCGICLVELKGSSDLIPSCETIVVSGMDILTDSESVIKARQRNLVPIMAQHPHSCLTCSQRVGCITLSADCSNSVIINDRCCEINGNCELQRLADYIGIAGDTPKFHHIGIPRIEDEELIIRDYNLCISCGRCVRACQQLRNVHALGAVIHNGKLIIGTVNGKHLSEADCRFCGACVEVCPTGAIQDRRKPRLKDYSDYLPCRANCPGDTDIPTYLRLISEGNPQASAEVIASKLSFPHSLGKVCFHPCETECRRNGLSEAINIRGAKDYAMMHSELQAPVKMSDTGKTISIIGAGPAGLTAGYYLSLKGHRVTIYEKEEKIGGMLYYGIPKYRLPDEILLKDLNRLLQSGMEIKLNTEVGKDVKITTLLDDGSNAVFLAAGLSKSRMMDINLPNSENIYFGIEFLNSVAKGEFSENQFSSEEIIVIGGGNVASDAARTALRLGAEKVTMICLENKDEMPVYSQEINEALEEGIVIENEWGVQSVEISDLINLELKKCISVFNSNGNFSPQFDNTIIRCATANKLILCIGQEIDSVVLDDMDTAIINRGFIRTKYGTYQTTIKGLFAAGDIVSGPKSVIDAIGGAKQAAREIDKYLGGNGIINGDDTEEIQFDGKIGKITGFCGFQRIPQSIAAPSNRKNNFELLEYSYDEETVKFETSRCLQCNLRMKIRQNPYPPDNYIEFNTHNIIKVKAEEGVIQLLNMEKEVILIKGTDNMRDTLQGFYNDGKEARYFVYEFDPLFSKKESELVQQYLQKYGKMPDSGDELDDLF